MEISKIAVLSPKRCISTRKNQFHERTTKTDLMDNFTMNVIWFCHFLLLLNFTTLKLEELKNGECLNLISL